MSKRPDNVRPFSNQREQSSRSGGPAPQLLPETEVIFLSIIELNARNCKNCYKCVRYCPVKAIEVKEDRAQILEEECILCGTCTVVCPQYTGLQDAQTVSVSAAIQAGEQVIASVDPSYAAWFSTSFPVLRQALRELGFADAFETAEGAFLVKREYERLVHANPGRTYLSSNCAAVNNYIRKSRPKAQKYLLPVLTAVQAHAKLLKTRYPQGRIVYLTPCVAKKGEQHEPESCFDDTLLFDEVRRWLDNSGILVQEIVGRNNVDPKLSRLFPKAGGILETMDREPGWRYLMVDGFEDCAAAIDDVIAGRMANCFIELNYCRSGCIGGPSFRKLGMSSAYSELKVRNSANTRDHSVDFTVEESVDLTREFKARRVLKMSPSQAQIDAVLRQIGKHDPEDQINCGMCGYSTCREKAIAVLQGKAEAEMCLPFMRQRAESFANTVVDILPEALVSVDGSLKVQQINRAACQLFQVEPDMVVGQSVGHLMDEYDFVTFLASGELSAHKRTYLTDTKLYLEQTFQLDRESGTVLVTLKDLTEETRQKRRNSQTKLQAAALADEIVNKQLRTVHEIAFLLGETAAETKSAVKDLKDAILLEEEDT